MLLSQLSHRLVHETLVIDNFTGFVPHEALRPLVACRPFFSHISLLLVFHVLLDCLFLLIF